MNVKQFILGACGGVRCELANLLSMSIPARWCYLKI